MKPNLSLPALCTYLVFGYVYAQMAAENCPCDDQKDCDHPVQDVGIKKEVFVFSNGTTDVNGWSWDYITALIVPSTFNISNRQEANTMCIAHSKKRKFGIQVEMSFSDRINDTSEEAKEWVQSVISQQRNWHAEIITINLLPYFSSDMNSFRQDHISLVKIVSNMKEEIAEVTEVVKVACIISWKPPCSESDASCDFSHLSQEACDYYIINPESFTDLANVKCRARANIPLSKLLYGISEYNSHHISNHRIILGVPWHGYDYTCESVINEICSLNEVTHDNNTKCNFSKRKKVSIGDILMKNITDFKEHKFDALYNAPYFSYYNTTDGHQHQVWFEDQVSLMSKYRLVAELKLKGLGLLYGDDLHASMKNPITETSMWTWVAHEVILKTSEKPVSNSLYYADTISGVAIGCLFLGAALGTVFTCFGLRSRVKKPQPHFVRDMNDGLNEYTDEDLNL